MQTQELEDDELLDEAKELDDDDELDDDELEVLELLLDGESDEELLEDDEDIKFDLP